MNRLSNILMLAIFFGMMSATAQTLGTDIGNKVPEIRLPSPEGDTIALSSLQGQVVLIDFWASWCAPCVQEQPELAELYRKYRNSSFIGGKGFSIYGVSLDSKKANWENIISRASIDWIQVSDLKFWLSPVAKLYNVSELPFNLLIDGNGIIIAKNLHGTDLDRELAKRMKPGQE